MIEPIDEWEADLFPVFDRLKNAMDKQDEARLAGTLDDFVSRGGELFGFLETLTWNIHRYNPVKTEWVYLTWKSSRGINSWCPDKDLPLRWFFAENVPVPVPTAEAIMNHKAKYQGWKDTDKANAKAMKAEVRRMEKEQRVVAKKKGDK